MPTDKQGASEIARLALQGDDMRCQALLAGDAKRLATLVDADLSYTHSTGRHDTRESYLAGIASGRTRYTVIDRQGVTAREVNGAGVVEGTVRLEVTHEGAAKSIRNHYLAVWKIVDGKPLLTAWASTALP